MFVIIEKKFGYKQKDSKIFIKVYVNHEFIHGEHILSPFKQRSFGVLSRAGREIVSSVASEVQLPENFTNISGNAPSIYFFTDTNQFRFAISETCWEALSFSVRMIRVLEEVK